MLSQEMRDPITYLEKPMPDDEAGLRKQLEALHTESFGWALACCGNDPAEAEEVLPMCMEIMSDPYEPQEERLRELLRQLRRDRERRMPPFQKMWQAALDAREFRSTFVWRVRPPWTLATVAVVAAIAGTSYIWLRLRPQPPILAPPAIQASAPAGDWQMPTDLLLDLPVTVPLASLRQITREIEALSSP